jgi:transcriptional regulator with XRE-family HTH domain
LSTTSPSESAHLGDRVAKLRRLSGLTQEQVADRAGVSVDVVRKLEQHRKHAARLPTLHALAGALGVELTTLIGDPPAIAGTGVQDPPALIELRRAVMPSLVPRAADNAAVVYSVDGLREQIANSWSRYHAADFTPLMTALPQVITEARLFASIGSPEQKATGSAALGKALQLAGHLAIRLGKTDLALAALERAAQAAAESGDDLLVPMVHGSVAWAYQRQNRLDDAEELAVTAADGLESDLDSAARIRVWGGLLMSAATSAARMGNYDHANDVMTAAEERAQRLATMPPPEDDGRLLSVFSQSSVRIERVRLAVQHARPEEALRLASGLRLSRDIPPSWRTWLLLDLARAYTDLGNSDQAVRTMEKLRTTAPAWMRQHTQAVTIVTELQAAPRHPPGLRKLAEFLGVAA